MSDETNTQNTVANNSTANIYPKTHVDERLSILDLGVESLLEASGVHLRQQVLHRIHLAHVAHAQQERRPRERRQRREGHQPPVNGTNVLGACSHAANKAPTFDGQAVPYGSALMVRGAGARDYRRRHVSVESAATYTSRPRRERTPRRFVLLVPLRCSPSRYRKRGEPR